MGKMKQISALEQELKDIETGEEILQTRKTSVETELKEVMGAKDLEEVRAIIIQLNSQPKMNLPNTKPTSKEFF